MPRNTVDEAVDRGILSTGTLAKLLLVTPSQVRGWCDKGFLKFGKIPMSKERRITGRDALAFAVEHNAMYDKRLEKCAQNYGVMFTEGFELRLKGEKIPSNIVPVAPSPTTVPAYPPTPISPQSPEDDEDII
jgi:hypothetical protein